MMFRLDHDGDVLTAGGTMFVVDGRSAAAAVDAGALRVRLRGDWFTVRRLEDWAAVEARHGADNGRLLGQLARLHGRLGDAGLYGEATIIKDRCDEVVVQKRAPAESWAVSELAGLTAPPPLVLDVWRSGGDQLGVIYGGRLLLGGYRVQWSVTGTPAQIRGRARLELGADDQRLLALALDSFESLDAAVRADWGCA